MLYLDSFDELVSVLKECAFEEDSGHAVYISEPEKITQVLASTTKLLPNARPEFINFNNFLCEGCEYYTFTIDCSDGDLRYSICPTFDEYGELYPDYGLCLVDECVYDEFEEEYKFVSRHDYYEDPIRISWGEEPEEDDNEDEDCKKCTYKCDAPCCKKNETKVNTKIDTDDDGKVCGFTKSWEDDNSFFMYSYHSADEDNVLDLMKKFQIKQ